MHVINIDDITIFSDRVVVRIRDLLKQSKPSQHLSQLVFSAYHDKRLCIVETLQEYISRTSSLRGNEKKILITTQPPFRAVAKSTISRWIKTVMQEAGIDTSIFGAHSTRAASSTAAAKMKLSLHTIIKTVGWSNDCTFRKFYHKPVSDSLDFSSAVLGKSQL